MTCGLINRLVEDTTVSRRLLEYTPVIGYALSRARLSKHKKTLLQAMEARKAQRFLPKTGYENWVLEDLLMRMGEEQLINKDCVVLADDEIGALLWDPIDCLSGVQILIELEEKYGLKQRMLDWEKWRECSIADLVTCIAMTSGAQP